MMPNYRIIDLLGLTAIAAIFSAAASYAYTAFHFILSMIVCALLAVIFVRILQRVANEQSRHVSLFAVGLAIGACAVMCFFPFLALFCLSLVGLSVVASLFKVTSTRTIMWGFGTCWSVCMLIMIGIGSQRVKVFHTLQSRYPAESLTDRLAYESTSSNTNSRLPTSLAPAVEKNLGALESMWLAADWARDHGLRRLHFAFADQFAFQDGLFGVSRMALPNKDSHLAKDPLETIPFSADISTEVTASYPTSVMELRRKRPHAWNNAVAFWSSNRTGSSEDELQLRNHWLNLADFLDPSGFGVAAVGGRVGFIPHAYHHGFARPSESQSLTLVRLELVSLLRFSEPRVYVLDHLPRMDHIASESVPTRPLNSFEASSLRSLIQQEDLVVERDEDRLQMLGSLRAASICLDCHHVQRGELLGAFSYVLVDRKNPSDHETNK